MISRETKDLISWCALEISSRWSSSKDLFPFQKLTLHFNEFYFLALPSFLIYSNESFTFSPLQRKEVNYGNENFMYMQLTYAKPNRYLLTFPLFPYFHMFHKLLRLYLDSPESQIVIKTMSLLRVEKKCTLFSVI